MSKDRARLPAPTLEEVARDRWEVDALLACDDPVTAKRLTALRYWLETRRPGATRHRVILAPRSEVPRCDS